MKFVKVTNARGLQRAAATLSSLALVSLLASCGADAEAALPPLLPSGQAAPLGSFTSKSDDDLALLARADAILVAECMRERGFEYSSTPPSIAPEPDPYGRLQPELVAEYGYGLPLEYHQGDERVDLSDKSDAFVANLLGEKGTGAGGCLDSAESALFGRETVMSDIRNRLASVQADAFTAALEDERYESAMSDWSSCISSKGYSAETFGDLIGQYSEEQESEGSKAPRTEVRAATDDLACRNATSVNDLLEQIDHAYQAEAVQGNEHLVERYDEFWSASLRRAQTAIDEH